MAFNREVGEKVNRLGRDPLSMIPCRYRFPKEERILKRKDFLRVQEKGIRFITDTLVILRRQNGLEISRLGITASKRVGNAVVRNRVKRWVRESYRKLKGDLVEELDIVMVVRKSAVKAGSKKVREDVQKFIYYLRGEKRKKE